MKLRHKIKKGLKKTGKRLRRFGKDVGTATARVVTDTAIDLGDVATGFKYSDKMQNAKQKLADAGVKSAAEVIENNHFGDLKRMEDDAQRSLESLRGRCDAGERLAAELTQSRNRLWNMLDQAALLAQISEESRDLLETLDESAVWTRGRSDVPSIAHYLETLESAENHWDRVGTQLTIAGAASGLASATTGVGAWRALARVNKLSKVASLAGGAKATKAAQIGSKLAKVGKIAGRASGVLSVAAIGLDLGTSVAQLKSRQEQLRRQLEELRQGNSEAQQVLDDIQEAQHEVQQHISALLSSVDDVHDEASWEQWYRSTMDRLQQAHSQLMSAQSAHQKARRLASRIRDRGYGEHARTYVAGLDPRLTLRDVDIILEQVEEKSQSEPQLGVTP